MADEELLCTLESLPGILDHSEKSWTEVNDILEKLKTWATVKTNRCSLSETNVLQVKDIIMACKDMLSAYTGEEEQHQLILCLKTLTEAFRFLRNCCAEIEKNQNSIVSSGVVEPVIDIVIILLKPKYPESEKGADVINGAIRSSLQLLGNTVVQNDDTQQFVWKKCFPKFFLDVLSSTNHVVQDCLCMIIYNCLNEQRRLQLISDHGGLKIISHTVHLCSDKSQLEWGYFILDYLISSGLFPEMYQGIEFDTSARVKLPVTNPLSPDVRMHILRTVLHTFLLELGRRICLNIKTSDPWVILLDLFQVKITDALDQTSNKSTGKPVAEELYASSFSFLADQFEKHAVDITQRIQQLDYSADDFFQVLIVTRLLSLLSTSTGLQSRITGLQERTSLLETCVGVLKETTKPEAKETFSNVSSIPQGADSGRLSPSHGFQRDLVRVIGNMCYRHTDNQNKVRELEGIPLLLDHCNVDDHNPYICQWAIFAIRNILENNKANQDVVSAMDPRGLADASRLRQFGVEAVEFDNGRIKLVPIK